MFRHYFMAAEPRGDWSPAHPDSHNHTDMGHLAEEFHAYVQTWHGSKSVGFLATVFLRHKVGSAKWHTLSKKVQQTLRQRLTSTYKQEEDADDEIQVVAQETLEQAIERRRKAAEDAGDLIDLSNSTLAQSSDAAASSSQGVFQMTCDQGGKTCSRHAQCTCSDSEEEQESPEEQSSDDSDRSSRSASPFQMTCASCGKTWDGHAQCTCSDSEDEEEEFSIRIAQSGDYPFDIPAVAELIRTVLGTMLPASHFSNTRDTGLCTFHITTTADYFNEIMTKIEATGIELEDDVFCYQVSSVPDQYLLADNAERV